MCCTSPSNNNCTNMNIECKFCFELESVYSGYEHFYSSVNNGNSFSLSGIII